MTIPRTLPAFNGVSSHLSESYSLAERIGMYNWRLIHAQCLLSLAFFFVF